MSRRLCLITVLAVLASALASAQKKSGVPDRGPDLAGVPTGATRVLDLSHALSDRVVPWPGSEGGFEATTQATYEKDGYFARSIRMLEHFGTHMDAPAHFIAGAATVDQIPPARLFGPAVVIDVRPQTEKNADYRMTAADIAGWEKHHGHIPPGAIVLLRTGWASRWPDVARYRNADAQGVMHFPGYSAEAVKLLLERKVSGLGIDTLSIDYGPSAKFEVHQVSHAAGLYHLENLADLSTLPEAGAFLIVAPIKLEGGSGGPVRVFAILGKQ